MSGFIGDSVLYVPSNELVEIKAVSKGGMYLIQDPMYCTTWWTEERNLIFLQENKLTKLLYA